MAAEIYQACLPWEAFTRQVHRQVLRREQIRRERARSNLLPFIQYFNDQYTTTDFQVHLTHQLDQFVLGMERGRNPMLMIFAPPRHGKALVYGTKVPTLRGMENIEKLRPGDFVIGSTGAPVRVTHTQHWENRPLYRVTTDDGWSVVVDENHEWEVRLDRKRPVWRVYDTKTLAARTSPRRPLIRMVRVLGETKPLPIPPYTLGVWLGDGNARQGTVCKPVPDQQHLRQRIEVEGFQTTTHTDARNFGVLGLLPLLQRNKLIQNKHIPAEYLTASVEQRMALLQGLMDTDGYVSPKGQCEYCSVSEVLATQVAHLVHSLGVKASVITGRALLNGVDHGPKYRVMFYMKGAASLPRKAQATKDGEKTPGRFLSFTKLPEVGNTCCITVDSPDHLYLATEACILTHNSEAVSRMLPALMLGKHPEWEIINACATQDLADEFGLFVRNLLNDPRYQDLFPNTQIDPSSNAISRITTTARGGYRGVGVGGQVYGRGAHVLIMDDLYKGAEEALSETSRGKVARWYRSQARNRLAPNGGAILMFTRWHVEDIAGDLLSNTNEDADVWSVLSYPAECIDPDKDLLGRDVGEALDRLRWPLKRLKRLRAAMTAAEYAALFLQAPYVEQGDFFRLQDFMFYTPEQTPQAGDPRYTWFLAFDLAVTKNTLRDRCAIVPVAMDKNRQLYIAPDFVFEHCEITEAADHILRLHRKYDFEFACGEKGVIEHALGSVLRERSLASNTFIRMEPIHRGRDKAFMAGPIRARMRQRTVYWPQSPVVSKDIIPSFLRFNPEADNGGDDFIDALANLGQHLLRMYPPSASASLESQSSDPRETARLRAEAEEAREDEEHWRQITKAHTPGLMTRVLRQSATTAPLLSFNDKPLHRHT